MPIYEYSCECKNVFSKLFGTMSQGAPFLDSHKCEKCGKDAKRVISQIGRFVMNFGDTIRYSSNSDIDKNG